jgi:hypothetical protein
MAWIKPRLLLAAVGEYTVVGVDPVAKRIRWRRFLPSGLEGLEATDTGFVLLLGPVGADGTKSNGPTRLVTVGSDGSLRSAVLDRIRSSFPDFTEPSPSNEYRRPGLAVDRVGKRAYEVGAGEPVAEVDLTTMTVTYHGGSRTLAKGVNGPQREATWIGDGQVAVTGTDAHAVVTKKNGRDDLHWWYTPAGLSLVDTRDWSWKLIDPDASSVLVANGLLLASAWIYDSEGPTQSGIGVAAYGLDGTPRFHLLDGAVVDVVAGAGFVYAWHNGVTVIDPVYGRVVNTVARADVFPLTSN